MYIIYLKYYIYKYNSFIINKTKKATKNSNRKWIVQTQTHNNVKHTKIYSQYEWLDLAIAVAWKSPTVTSSPH